jgi:hypothetical protein
MQLKARFACIDNHALCLQLDANGAVLIYSMVDAATSLRCKRQESLQKCTIAQLPKVIVSTSFSYHVLLLGKEQPAYVRKRLYHIKRLCHIRVHTTHAISQAQVLMIVQQCYRCH